MGIEEKDGSLWYNSAEFLSSVPPLVKFAVDDVGIFLYFQAKDIRSLCLHPSPLYFEYPIGSLCANVCEKFVSCARTSPWWMGTFCGTKGKDIPEDTQFMLVKLGMPDSYVAVFPLVHAPFRASLRGSIRPEDENEVLCVVETGCEIKELQDDLIPIIYIAAGANPYTLVSSAVDKIAAKLKTFKTRKEKSVPAIVDYFGWCTWDAFYHDVSLENIRRGLESFQAGGIFPKFVIVDDGWQQYRKMESGEGRMYGFEANEKFPDGLKNLVEILKNHLGVKYIYLWHNTLGYWGGVDGSEKEMEPFKICEVETSYSQKFIYKEPNINYWFGSNKVGLVHPTKFSDFYEKYHQIMHHAGIDGAKVDNQGSLEAISHTVGGRVSSAKLSQEALASSVQKITNFGIINCMSCTNDILFHAQATNLTRTSDDFFPNRPESHPYHLWNNATVSFFTSDLIFPDWDMFQSGHPMGAFHAAARAVSGGPIYVSDKPDSHDFPLLKKLALPNGEILRPMGIARPTLDCLFRNPLLELIIYKIFNVNIYGGVIGAFNICGQNTTVCGRISPRDVVNLEGDAFVMFSHKNQKAVKVCDDGGTWELELNSMDFDIITVVPIGNGFAGIGLIEMFNSGGAILDINGTGTTWEIKTKGEGRFAFYSERPVREVIAVDGKKIAFESLENNVYTIILPENLGVKVVC